MTSAPRSVGLGLAFGLAVGLAVGLGSQQPSRAAAAGPSAAGSPGVGGTSLAGTAAAGTSLAGTAAAGTAVAGTAAAGTAVAGTAIAYPYFAGTPGLAPEGTIVVTGAGQAEGPVDGSGRESAQKAALADALADAKAQAEAIAGGAGLTITGVYSVSASTFPSYGVMPMAGPAGGSAPGRAIAPVTEAVPPQTLSVSVTVAYRVG
jgi:hypothetical protein